MVFGGGTNTPASLGGKEPVLVKWSARGSRGPEVIWRLIGIKDHFLTYVIVKQK